MTSQYVFQAESLKTDCDITWYLQGVCEVCWTDPLWQFGVYCQKYPILLNSIFKKNKIDVDVDSNVSYFLNIIFTVLLMKSGIHTHILYPKWFPTSDGHSFAMKRDRKACFFLLERYFSPIFQFCVTSVHSILLSVFSLDWIILALINHLFNDLKHICHLWSKEDDKCILWFWHRLRRFI